MGASVSSASSQISSQPASDSNLHLSFLGQGYSSSGYVSPSPLEPLGKEKKRKSTTLSTLRRRLIRKRRTSKSFDHAQVFRSFLSFWIKKDIVALIEEYEASAALKDLTLQADLARPDSNTCRQDLGELFECKYFSDINLIYQGVTFPVHRALLAARCPFFRELLNDISLSCSEVVVDIDIAGMSIQMFSDLLKYLYTGELSVTEKSEGSLNVLLQLSEQFGIPNPIEQDLKFLLDSGLYCDAHLVFSSSGPKKYHMGCGGVRRFQASSDLDCGGFPSSHDCEIPCHIAILSARSPFFRNVIRRHFERQADLRLDDLVPARIVLDEGIIPRRFAKIIVQALYQDVPDFSTLVQNLNRVSSVNDLHLSSSMMQKDPIDETMQLYEIARFLDMDALAQSCEDALVEALSLETLIGLLRWSSQSHGSPWVRRQALAFLREEFTTIAASQTLLQIDKKDLVEVLQSDYVQASELEILQAVLKWGEHQLLKRMEEREPNLVSQTAHSVSRRGLKRRDLCDVELREILAEVVCQVRTDHVLPPDSEVLLGALKRGLIASPPSHMLGDELGLGAAGAGGSSSSGVTSVGNMAVLGGTTIRQKVAAWTRSSKGGPYTRPRLFLPYIEEAKSWLEEEFGQEAEVGQLRPVWQISHIPDTLYMVDKPFLDWHPPTPSLDMLRGMVLDDSTVQRVRKREAELRQSLSIQRAYSLNPNPGEVTRLLLLRVAREMGLPDLAVDILQQHVPYMCPPEEVPEDQPSMPQPFKALGAIGGSGGGVGGARGAAHPLTGYPSPMELHKPPPPPPPPAPTQSSQQVHRRFCSEHHLSGRIPDIAMATSLLGRMQLLDQKGNDDIVGEQRDRMPPPLTRSAMARSALRQNRDICR